MTPREYASALYQAVRGKDRMEVNEGVQRLVEALKTRGAVRLLPQVLAELPAAIDLVEAPNRVTIETARELDEKAVERIARAAGASEHADVRQKVRPELIGGARVKTHGTTLDASIKGRLEKIRTALTRRTA